MNSPFPGMDPFLEAHWRDVHASLVIYIRDALQAALPGSLFARVEERVFLEAEEGEPLRSTYPDVRVVGWRPPEAGESVTTAEGATAVLDEPHVIQSILEPATETFLEIIDASSGHRVVTVIEVLSPTNKLPGPGQEMYLVKQKEMKQGNVNLVEIDLVRQGDRVTSLPGKQQPGHLQSLYQVCVWRPIRTQYEIYPIPLGVRLPRIRIPLRPKDEDIRLDLQAVLDQAYRNGRYFATLDYHKPLQPPLDSENAQRLAELLKPAAQ
jgi:hypothetical protein